MIPPSLILDSYPTPEFKFERGNIVAQKPGGLQKMNRQIRQYKIEFQMQWHELLMCRRARFQRLAAGISFQTQHKNCIVRIGVVQDGGASIN